MNEHNATHCLVACWIVARSDKRTDVFAIKATELILFAIEKVEKNNS